MVDGKLNQSKIVNAQSKIANQQFPSALDGTRGIE
jgi:hypothetical protein